MDTMGHVVDWVRDRSSLYTEGSKHTNSRVPARGEGCEFVSRGLPTFAILLRRLSVSVRVYFGIIFYYKHEFPDFF